jgi:hypothetical protein
MTIFRGVEMPAQFVISANWVSAEIAGAHEAMAASITKKRADLKRDTDAEHTRDNIL